MNISTALAAPVARPSSRRNSVMTVVRLCLLLVGCTLLYESVKYYALASMLSRGQDGYGSNETVAAACLAITGALTIALTQALKRPARTDGWHLVWLGVRDFVLLPFTLVIGTVLLSGPLAPLYREQLCAPAVLKRHRVKQMPCACAPTNDAASRCQPGASGAQD